MKVQDRLDMMADFIFRMNPSHRYHNLKEYAKVWLDCYLTRVVDSKRNIKNENLYNLAKRFITDIEWVQEEDSLAPDHFTLETWQAILFNITEVIGSTRLKPNELKWWQKAEKRINTEIATIKDFIATPIILP